MAGEWVTAGAPLESGDGWRIWYSWPTGEFTPATPRVRTTGGPGHGGHRRLVAAGAAGQGLGPPDERPRAADPERHAGRALRGHDPRARPPALLAHAADRASRRRPELPDRLVLLDQRRPRRLLLGGGPGARPARAARVQGADGRPALRRRVGAESAQGPAQGPGAEVRALLGRRPLPGAARGVPELRQLRRPRVLERLPRAADARAVQLAALRAGERDRVHRALRRLSGSAQPRRRPLDVVPREADLVLHRRHALEPHPPNRPAGGAGDRAPVAGPGAVGGRARRPRRARAPAAAAEGRRQPDRPYAASTSSSPIGCRRSSNARSAVRPPTASRTTS